MDRKFLMLLEEKENRCRNLQKQADEFFRQNDRIPCADQCNLLQQAADLESEMSRLTMGAEREHHVREKNRLDYEIMRIRSEIDKCNGSVTSPKLGSTKGAEKTIKNTNGPGKAKDEEELDRTVNTWYKKAPNHNFEDVSGMAELKKKLNACIVDSRAGDLMEYLKIPRLNSYFFVGPPGCGKTYIIEAFAHELMDQDYKFISIQGSDIISRYVGAAEKSVTRLFEEAEKNAPCIVFIDEIDSLCKNRSLPNLPEYAANITTSFLMGYNRIHNVDSKVIFIAATNYPDRVDNAMLDRVEIIRVPLPDTDAREAVFTKHFSDIVKLHDITFRDMALMTRRCNYRDIDRLSTMIKRMLFREVLDLFKHESVAIEMLRNGKYKLTRAKFNDILSKFVPSPKESILGDLRKWEKSVQSITESADADINHVYEPDNNEAAEDVIIEEPMKINEILAEEDVSSDPVYPLQKEYFINPETGCVDIVFCAAQGHLAGISACINSTVIPIIETDNGYAVQYHPESIETEVEVFITDANGYVGSFTVKIGSPIKANKEFNI